MGNQLEFDFASSDAFRGQLETSMQTVRDRLQTMEREVEKVREWWKGGSEEGFIRNFSTTRRKIDRKLNEVQREYQRLVTQVRRIKEQEERDMRAALQQRA
jgi:uncharacterized protein YukE